MLLLAALPLLLGAYLLVDVFDDDGEVVDGTTGDDEIASGGGAQTINAGAGDDLLNGNGGDDTINAGTGDDLVEGGFGDDTINLGDGNDQSGWTLGDFETLPQTHLQTGDDTINGGGGSDVIVDILGSNTLSGGTGADLILAVDEIGADAPDVVDGGAGDDYLVVDDGDTVTGGSGDDYIEIFRDEDDDDSVVVVTDFNNDEDTIDIAIQNGLDGFYYSLDRDDATLTEQDGGVMVSRDGVDLVFFEGASAADVRAALPVEDP